MGAIRANGPLAPRALRFLRTSETSSVVHAVVHAVGAWAPRTGIVPVGGAQTWREHVVAGYSVSLNDPANAEQPRERSR
jgi:hypothetical protein